MRLVMFVASLSLAAAGCGKKNQDPTPPTQPTKVTEPDSVPATAKPVEEVAVVAKDDAAAAAKEDGKQGAEDPDAAKAPEPAPTAVPEVINVAEWMSWEGGIDFVGMTKEGLPMPNVVFHIGRVVHTPLGAAASGMIMYQPDADKPPVAAGFVSTSAEVGAYFGPKIFAGTPFEKAPAMVAEIEVKYDAAAKTASARVKIGDNVFEAELSDIGQPYLINRAPAQMTPFHQQGVEAKAGKVVFKVNGAEVPVMIPPVGLAGGPGAVWADTGVYAR